MNVKFCHESQGRFQTKYNLIRKKGAYKIKYEAIGGLSNAYRSPSGTTEQATLQLKRIEIFIATYFEIQYTYLVDTHTTLKQIKRLWKHCSNKPDVSRLVGHSLSSAVINEMNEEQPKIFSTTTYATPTITPIRKGQQNPRQIDLRNPNYVISMLAVGCLCYNIRL